MPEPGAQRKRAGFKNNAILSRFRRAWVQLENLQVSMYLYPERTPDPEASEYIDTGTTVVVWLSTGRQSTKIDLTSFTTSQLNAFKQIVDMACASALETTIVRDQEAMEALDAGDTSYQRVYRGFPKLFVREGSEHDDSPRIRRGSEWTPAVDESYEVDIASLGAGRVDVPERDAVGHRPQDNPS